MKIKKVIAPSMPDAMKKIKDELGQDAIILNSKETRTGGFFGLFSKKGVEVIAAIDPVPPRQNKGVPLSEPDFNDEGLMKAEVMHQSLQQAPASLVNVADAFKENPLTQELSDHSPDVSSLIQRLKDQGVSTSYLKMMEKNLLREWYKHDESLSMAQLKDILHKKMVESLASNPFGPVNKKNHIVNLVGPTGVGKTTTLAKLASKAVLSDGLSVAFITTDTYRIAAIEQLKTYAELLNVPITVAYNLEDFKEAINTYKHIDLLLIDSAGRNYQDAIYVQELKNTIAFSEEMVTYLVLSATMKYEDMKAIYEQFISVPISQLIVTKVDETSSYGGLLNLLIDHPIGISYITNGQNVPDDIYNATPQDIIQKILGVKSNG